MLEPDNQKVYFIENDDLSKLYPDAEDAQDKALGVLEGEQSFIIVDGEQLPIGYDSEKDAILVEDSSVSDSVIKKARKLLDLFVKNELFGTREIEKENGFMPDNDYPMSVNVTDGNSYHTVSYYPSMQQMANAQVHLWTGSGYSPHVFYVNVHNGDRNPEEALETAVVLAEKIDKSVLLDVAETEQAMADDGHYDKDSGEGDAVFEETYIYVDATMLGASQPYYVYAENFGVLPNKGELA